MLGSCLLIGLRSKFRLASKSSSGAGRVVIPGLALYSASKFALEALAEAYRHELASQGIDSAIVEPGPFVTPIFQKQEEAADTLRSSGYGPASEIPQNLFKELKWPGEGGYEPASRRHSIAVMRSGRATVQVISQHLT